MARPRTLALLRARTPGAVARGGVLATAMLSLRCEDDPRVCPITWWSSDPTSLEAPCRPPEGYEDAVRDRIGTGFWGYALGCSDRDDDDDCTCRLTGLATPGELAVTIDPGPAEEHRVIQIRSDGTFELPAEAGRSYAFPSVSPVERIGADGGVLESYDTVEPLSLEEGEVLQLRVRVWESC